MAETLKDLRRRVRSIRNIKQITRAMEMVSAAKLRRAQATLMAARPYAQKLQEMLSHVANSTLILEHPLFKPRAGNRKIMVLFSADRGLCGSFNANLIKEAETRLRNETETQWQLVTVGKRGRDYFGRRKWPILRSWEGFRGQADSAAAREIATFLLEQFEAEYVDEIVLLYPQYVSTVLSRPTLAQYLPLTPEALGLKIDETDNSHEVDYILEPDAESVFDLLLPRYLSSKIYITMAELATSEHSARMVAMNNASKNCKELGNALTLKMNKARQASITKELLEIVAGAEAIKAG